MNPRLCFECKKPGHLVAQCPQRLARIRQGKARLFRSPSSDKEHLPPSKKHIPTPPAYPPASTVLDSMLMAGKAIGAHFQKVMGLPFHPTPSAVATLALDQSRFDAQFTAFNQALQMLTQSQAADLPELGPYRAQLGEHLRQLEVARGRLTKEQTSPPPVPLPPNPATRAALRSIVEELLQASYQTHSNAGGHGFPPSSQWVRDLTQEGIEPNPGPSSPAAPSPLDDVCMEDSSRPGVTPQDPPQHSGSQPDENAFQKTAPEIAGKDIFGLHLRTTSNGLWFDQKPLASQELLQLCGRLQNAPVDLLLTGDGLSNPLLPQSLPNYHIFSHQHLSPPQLQGHHSLFLASTPLPFDDSPPIFSLKSWVGLFQSALGASGKDTRITVVLMARLTSAALCLLPTLDRRFELDRLKRWKSGIWVLPDARLGIRDPRTAEVALSPLPTPFPLLIFGVSSACRHLIASPKIAWIQTPPPLEIPPEAQAVHVLLNVPSSTTLPNGLERPTSGNRILGMINLMDPGETSTQLRMAVNLRYPPHWIPTIQKSSPDKVTVAHYLVPRSIVEKLEEDTESLISHNIRWMIFSDERPTYLVNHLPHRSARGAPAYKFQAPEVVDSLLCNTHVARAFDECLVFNRWDAIVRIADGIDLPILAATLSNSDHLLLLEAGTNQVIKPSSESSTVQPLHLILASPPPFWPHMQSRRFAK